MKNKYEENLNNVDSLLESIELFRYLEVIGIKTVDTVFLILSKKEVKIKAVAYIPTSLSSPIIDTMVIFILKDRKLNNPISVKVPAANMFLIVIAEELNTLRLSIL